ncbi:MAG: carbohydrate kinase family protein [Patescibacteria group bacterium]
MEVKTPHDVIAVGDTTEDVFLQMEDASLQCGLKGNGECLICFDFAEKVPVQKKTDVPAVGNAANHAIGVSRLGLASAIYTVVGDDVQGRAADDIFKQNGVDTRYLAFDMERGTNYSVVINYKGERTIFVFHEPRKYKLPKLLLTKWVYLTSSSKEGLIELHRQVGAYLAATPGVKLAFNPGTHQLRLGKEGLKTFLRLSEVLFLNREESVRLLESKTNDIATLVRGFHALGVKVMVITDGPKGSYASNGKTIWHAGIFDGPVIERTGAGDAYGSGFLSAIVKGHDIPTAMAWGNANSTSVVAYIGAREGLLTEEGVLKMIAENKHVMATPYAG